MSIEVQISDTQGQLRIDPTAARVLVQTVLLAEHRNDASISIAFVDNSTLRRLNARHLGHDWLTDVISFPLSDPDDRTLAGELVVSAEMAIAQAREMDGDPLDELALYIIHGLLHLCGYDDATEEQSSRMKRRQAELQGACAGLTGGTVT